MIVIVIEADSMVVTVILCWWCVAEADWMIVTVIEADSMTG